MELLPFISMIAIIILLVGVIALIIGLSVSGNSTTNDVTTVNAVGQIGKDVILSCTFTPDVKQSSNVLWERVGLPGNVYNYQNGKISLTNQSPLYKGRASLFLNQLAAGNASLQLSNVQLTDTGVYRCTITNSNGSGQNILSLNVGAFSAITMTNISETTLRCASLIWLPKPTVTWQNITSGSDLTNLSTTTYEPNLGNSFQIISDYPGIQENVQYRCVINNALAKAEGNALLSASGLQTSTSLQILSSADVLSSPSILLLCLLSLIIHPGAALW
ncbi:V-set domain-containing T-cell activation inhibitor 1-like isoform X2 [Pseudophryne corroboree]|uniref:V-set domain-containing T-cell activation inhibitor 1-like isoform X2 n=1 Tax=Pseudophryne corroboree TaxID=495146 RepID=UPI003081ECF0